MAAIIRDILRPTLLESPLCLNLTQLKCIYEQQNKFVNEKLNECEVQCPLECEYFIYDINLSTIEYPTRELYNLFKKDQAYFNITQMNFGVDFSTFDLYKDHFVSLKVYYPYTQYVMIEQFPKLTFIDLLSQVGGSLAMFLGATLFSLVELFEIIFKVLFILFGKTNSGFEEN